jgi:hypothetical protein
MGAQGERLEVEKDHFMTELAKPMEPDHVRVRSPPSSSPSHANLGCKAHTLPTPRFTRYPQP